MKKLLLSLLATLLALHLSAQVTFEKGYFIDNAGQRTECLIKNLDWSINPRAFEYTLTTSGEPKEATIEEVKEFGIDGYSKYVRSTVGIDKSSDNLQNLGTDRNPTLVEEVLFLKVLVEGDFNLYYYQEWNFNRFFFGKGGSGPIEQLVFKKYLKASGDALGENNFFRQQLLTSLTCESLGLADVAKLKYGKRELVKFFKKYSECKNTPWTNYDDKQQSVVLNLTPRIGMSTTSLSIANGFADNRNADFERKIVPRLSIEAELIMPLNRNKWAIIFEPTYGNRFSAVKELPANQISVEYKSLEFPVGLRYYLFLNEKAKIFLNTSLVFDLVNKSEIAYVTGERLTVTSSFNLGFGLGFKYLDKASLELRVHSSRELLNTYVARDAAYGTISLIAGYQIVRSDRSAGR